MPNIRNVGSTYSRMARPIVPSTAYRNACSSVSATSTSRTSRQSRRSGVRPLRSAPSSTASQWVATYSVLRSRLMGM
ncbi:Uncharacterised protein [Mycobacterium tuberculosis]|uniref:Uncharacterized protein n=1 Tax=Mycobacterium tuberculosis TaxID=1773 RepID=A0A916LFV2_MYCTX|nr:Uncharacterised protein [Mycobacterium tuberculosis]